VPFAAIALGIGGCSSDSDDPPLSSTGGKAGTGGSAGSSSAGASGSAGNGGSAGTGAAVCTPLAGSAATIAAGPLWGCFQNACMTELGACAADCECNNATLTALGCVAGGGNQMTCFTPLAGAGATGLQVIACLVTSTPGCTAPPDAGSEEPGDAGDAG
jgi:hypothetical protein